MFEKRCGVTPRKKTAYNKKRPFSKQNRPNFVSLRGAQRRGNLKAEGMASRSEAREQKTAESPNFESTRSDATTALLLKRHFTRAQARISHASVSFTRPKAEFHCAALPCLVPGLRLVPSKIAASGIENALLAMTESVGFSEKRDSFKAKCLKNDAARHRAKMTAYNKKCPFSKQNRPNFVSLRGRPAAVAILK